MHGASDFLYLWLMYTHELMPQNVQHVYMGRWLLMCVFSEMRTQENSKEYSKTLETWENWNLLVTSLFVNSDDMCKKSQVEMNIRSSPIFWALWF